MIIVMKTGAEEKEILGVMERIAAAGLAGQRLRQNTAKLKRLMKRN